MAKVEISRIHKDFGMEAKDAGGVTIRMDTSPETGGDNFGVRPMQLLLMGLGGCSAIDIISILKKQKQQITSLDITVTGQREEGKEPSLWKEAKVEYVFSGTVDPEKARRACELSMTKYCSVAETLTKAGCKITWDIKLKQGRG
jgi:putative redox protein